MTLAERIDKACRDWDPYGYADSDCSVEYFEELLKEEPKIIICGLLDEIDDLMERLQQYE